ncbi:hypothetical protein ACVVIH_07010 [Chryseobacterium arthrosphaerae]
MSSKKYRKRLKEFYQNGKIIHKSCAEAMVYNMIALGKAIQSAKINMEKFNKKYHEFTSDKIGN